MRILTFFYTLWAAFWLIFLFLLLLPFLWLFLQKPEWKQKAHYLNKLWAKLFFLIIGISIKIQYEFEPDLKKAYVFCSNHFSYIDIPAMSVVVENYSAFVGKASISKIPLFGYLFARLHIQVDRDNKNSRSTSLNRSIKALQSGRSIMIFPEGGIEAKEIPKMHLPLKDGGFSMAIQQQVSIVPITFLNNYRIMQEGKFGIYPHTLRAIVHKPIDTTGMTKDDVNSLKNSYYEVVQGALDNYKA